MRIALLILGLLCCLIGSEILFVDKIVLHGDTAPAEEFSDEFDASSVGSGRVIDLPDSGGYVLVAVGVACIMVNAAMRQHKER